MSGVPVNDLCHRRARRVLGGVAVAMLWLAAAGCGLDGPASGVNVVAPPSAAPAAGAGADGEMALEASTDLDGDGIADEAPNGEDDGAADPPPESLPGPVSAPPAHLPRASLPPERPAPGELPQTAAVVGDSLTLSAREEIAAYLTALGIEVIEIDGAENRRMTNGANPESGIDVIGRIAETAQPDLWVIALGTNDVGSSVSPARFAGDVDAVLGAIPPDVPVVWVDLWIRDRIDDVRVANDVLRAVLDERDDTQIAEWFVHGDDTGLVTGDGVHLTADGRYMFAATIAAAIVDEFD
jgi:lysophospholipase L1-like esterase